MSGELHAWAVKPHGTSRCPIVKMSGLFLGYYVGGALANGLGFAPHGVAGVGSAADAGSVRARVWRV